MAKWYEDDEDIREYQSKKKPRREDKRESIFKELEKLVDGDRQSDRQ